MKEEMSTINEDITTIKETLLGLVPQQPMVSHHDNSVHSITTTNNDQRQFNVQLHLPCNRGNGAIETPWQTY